MTIEQKAKSYDKAIEKARQYHNEDCDTCKTCLEGIFDELKESEDERIRKAILGYLTIMWGNSQDDVCGVHVEDAIAWLEKQGEKKEINPTLQEKGRMDDAFTKMMLKPQVDGFDTELNALLKKYEHLPKKDLQEPLEFYLGVVRDDLDIVRDEKPKWSEEDEIGSDETIELLEYFINYAPEFRRPAIRRSIDWLKSLKKRMEE